MKSAINHFAVVCAFVLLSFTTRSQTDTLHLNYHHTQIKPHDTTVVKIEKWAKSLSGKHVDIRVVAYYHKLEFKKFADQRVEELFLVLNRKARTVITIVDQGSKKGKDYQRTMVDIIYTPTLTEADKKLKEDAEKAEAAKVAEAKKAANAEKSAKAKEDKAAKETAKASAKEESDNKKSKDKNDDGATAKEEKGKDEKSGAKGKSSKDSKSKKNDKASANGSPYVKAAGKGMYATQEDVARLKASKIVVPRTDDPELDSMLTEAVKDFWKFTSNVSYGELTYNEAKAQAKTDKDMLVFIVTNIKSSSLTHGSGAGKFKYVSSGSSVMLEDGKSKIALAGYFPTYSEDNIVAQEGISFAVSVMNSLMTNLDEKQIKNNMTVNKPYKGNGIKLKDKTLLIPEGWLTEKLDFSEIGNYYKAKYSVVDYEKWRSAILKKQNYAYVVVVPVPIGGNYVYQHYLMDASTGNVFFISQPKMATNISGINVTKSNTGMINSKNLQKYNDAFEGGGDDEETAEGKSDDKDEKGKSEEKSKGKSKKEEDDSKSEKSEKDEVKKEEKSKGKSKKKEDEEVKTEKLEKEVSEDVKKEEKTKKKKEDKKSKKTEEEKKEETKSE